MTNNEIVKAFAKGSTSGKANSMVIYGDKIFSYDTCIAQRYGGMVILNVTKYSVTTSKQKTYLAHALYLEGIEVIEVKDVKINTDDLIKFAK